MRYLYFVAALVASAGVQPVAAQTLEEAYAALCEPGRRSEACDALQQMIAERSAGTSESSSEEPAPELMRTWGPLARLVDTAWVHEGPTGIDMRHAYTWSPDGSSIRLQAGMPAFADADRTLEFTPGDQPGELKAHIRVSGFQGDAVFRFQDDRTLRADPYILSNASGSRLHYNEEMTLAADDVYVAGLASVSYPMAHLSMSPLALDVRDRYEAAQRMRGAAATIEMERKIQADLRAEEDAKREARRQRWSAVMGAMSGALDAGLEVARAQEAQSRYELDSTLADINAQARAQQAAQTQASAMRSGTGYTAVPAASPVSAPQASTTYTPVQGPGTGSWASAGQGSSGGADSPAASGSTSTRDDASMCVSPPVTSTHKCADLSGYKAMVSNTCAVPVDVRVCFMTDGGWNCQSNYGLAPEATWEPGWCHANTGEVFHAVRYSDSKEPLASP